jgi:hypothetical protein
MNYDVAVIVPFYTAKLNDNEKKNLVNNLKVLNDRHFIIVKPQSLKVDLNSILPHLTDQKDIEVSEFDDSYFASVNGYNRLLLSKIFYQRFIQYRYILICQLDAFIFKNDLQRWIEKGYDYVGAPWTKDEESTFIKMTRSGKIGSILRVTTYFNKMLLGKKDYRIGNGGFSLRNVKKSLSVLRTFGSYAVKWQENEDIFWAVLVPQLLYFFKIPNMQDALGFAFEREPKELYKLADEKLPFGCHAYEKYDPEFWAKFID